MWMISTVPFDLYVQLMMSCVFSREKLHRQSDVYRRFVAASGWNFRVQNVMKNANKTTKFKFILYFLWCTVNRHGYNIHPTIIHYYLMRRIANQTRRVRIKLNHHRCSHVCIFAMKCQMISNCDRIFFFKSGVFRFDMLRKFM